MKFSIFLIAILFAMTTQAQTVKSSPFKPLPHPKQLYSLPLGATATTEIKAWRFTPMAGYNVTTKQLQAGIGYGIQWMHYTDSTQKYYTDFSIQGVGWVNGNTTPSLYPPNIASFGITLGVLNQLVQGGFAYTPSTPNTKSNVGIIINFAIPLNN